MSILQNIYSFQTGVYTVTRRARGVIGDDGIYVQGAATTLEIRAVIQPAREIARVTAGRDMRENEQLQHVDDVMMLHTDTEVKTRTPTTDADIISHEGDEWTVVRVEKWPYRGVFIYQAIITRRTDGGS